VRQKDFRGNALAGQALPFVGHPVTRNRGTVGGSVAHADASAELPLCLLVLGGSVRTSKGREIAADDFFVTHFTTAVGPDELIVETIWPPGGSVAFEEFALRHGDFALSMCACSVRIEEGVVREPRVGVGSVVDRPTLLELGLDGAAASAETAREAGARAAALVDPPGNLHASANYLKHLTGVVD
jgi:2-furoyl-CoA dehydrogenase FAD binding subunit